MPTPADHPLLTAARDWFDAGFAVIPSHEDGGKRPFGPWKQYQAQRPTWAEIEGWLATGRFTGIGVLTGHASGNVEMVEIEGPTEAAAVAIGRVKAKADELGCADLMDRVFSGCISRSAGDGLHVFVRVADGPAKGNTKLAMSADGQVIAETRGEGGFVIVAPTPGRKGHREGAVYAFIASSNPARTVDISSAERDQLHAVFTAALDEAPATLPAPPKPATTYEGTSALDAYRATRWADILVPAGWTWSHRDAERDYWVRPGKSKTDGISASTIEDGPLVNFSTNVPWPTDVGLSKGQVYALLHHGGDVSAASRELSLRGYGDQLPIPSLPEWQVSTENGTDPTSDQADLYALAVQRKYGELRILEDARSLLAVAKVGQAPDLTGVALHDFLDQPDAPLRYRVDGLWPAEGRVLLAAAAKSGKTTLVAANLLPSLVDGRQFLGRHEAQPVTGTVVLLNMEVGENTLRRWLRDARVENRHKVVVANLRGKAAALTLATDKGRQRLADWLRAQRAEVVILDPLAPVLASLGLDENSNADVATFFSWWSEALSLAGVRDDVVVHHTGHAGQRSRGASRLLDEPDAVWTLSREADEETGEFVALDPVRYLAAYGRDVEMPPEALAFDRATKSLTLTGKGKEEVKGDKKVAAVLAAFTSGPMSKAAIKKAIGGNSRATSHLINDLVDNGVLEPMGKAFNGHPLLYPSQRLESE
jgi:hypothetical protein